MNIGFVTSLSGHGGGERLVLEEVRFFINEGHSVTLYLDNDSPSLREKFGIEGVSIRKFPQACKTLLPKDHRLHEIYWLRKKFLEDNIYLAFSYFHDIDVFLATRGINIDYTVHINGSPFWWKGNPALFAHQNKREYQNHLESLQGHTEFRDLSQFSLIKRVYHTGRERLRSMAISQSELVTTLTNHVAGELEFCYDVSPSVVRPGVSRDLLAQNISVSPEDLEEISTERMILNVGRLDKRKRNSLLIRAFAELHDRTGRDDVTLVIGGTGNQQTQLRELASELEINDKVVFVGYIPESDLAKYYKAANILAHPAWVAYGLVPLEAYSLGTKIAISSDTMVKEIIGSETNVEVFEPHVDEWAIGLERLLETSESEPNTDVVPTWTEYCETKYEILNQNGLV
jgi:glycosyltransferase involved in cell wall biosynthesis